MNLKTRKPETLAFFSDFVVSKFKRPAGSDFPPFLIRNSGSFA